MADKKKSPKYTEGEVEGTRDRIDPARDKRVKDIRDRLSAGDDGGTIYLDGGPSKFYNEVSPADVKRGWEEEARFPGPPKPGERFDQGKPRPMTIDPRDQAPPVESGGLIEAILHGLGLRGRK